MTGDGVPEILVIARDASGHKPEPGELYVIYGADPTGIPFIRGDASGDGAHDLTDVLTILNSLFLNAPEPACLDAADTDDDGAVNLTDAIALLNFLFVGGPPPPAPYPLPGIDPTDDALICARGG